MITLREASEILTEYTGVKISKQTCKDWSCGRTFVPGPINERIDSLQAEIKDKGAFLGSLVSAVERIKRRQIKPQLKSDEKRDQIMNMVDLENLKKLEERSRNIINMRLGINGYDKHTLQQCADMYGLTRERVRQIQNKAVQEMLR
jgi:DNA-directed RNA polymerase sigma subunit (sigma70/sigma32)